MAPQKKNFIGRFRAPQKNNFIRRFEALSQDWLDTEDPSTGVLVEEEERLETVSTLPEHDIHGFENEIRLLEIFLLDQKVYDEFKSFVVVGEFGVGKTALCQVIFNNNNVKSVYSPRIWVSMQSKETKVGEDKKIYVLTKILKGLGFEDDMLESIKTEVRDTAQEMELSALLYAVNLNLKWKKYLIVFDDVRGEDKWDEKEQLEGMKWGTHLSDGFPKGSGGRVIYTTREQTLVEKLDAEEHEMHCLLPLSDTETVKKIYEEAIEKNEEENRRKIDRPHPGNEKKFIEELMNKSRGVPLAARMMAKSYPVFEDKPIP